MKVKIESSKLVKPFYGSAPPPAEERIPLSVFDKITWDQHVAVIYAYRPPSPPNSAIELGLRKALAVYREWAGRLSTDADGERVIVLNDAGVRFVEASVDRILDETVSFMPSDAAVRSLHPALQGVVELVQVQITRFSCGSMVLGFTGHHMVADGNATSSFLVAWGRACRNLEISPLPFHDRTIFAPRDPPRVEYEHRGAEFMPKNIKKQYPLIENCVEDIAAESFHFTPEFLSKLKAKASSSNGNNKPFSTVESLVAHLWRAITAARGVSESETSQVRIAVDGRSRMRNPRVPNEFFGNLVLWSAARARVGDLLSEPVGYAAKLLHEAVVSVNDDYFKSFIDFAHHHAKTEDLVPTTTVESNEMIFWPNLDVGSWLRFPFYDLDFGGGTPYVFSPCFPPTEGEIYLLPSFNGDGGIDAFVPLFRENLKVFKRLCYSLE